MQIEYYSGCEGARLCERYVIMSLGILLRWRRARYWVKWEDLSQAGHLDCILCHLGQGQDLSLVGSHRSLSFLLSRSLHIHEAKDKCCNGTVGMP